MPYDAAIVLGAAVNRDGSPGEALRRRVATGAALVGGGRARWLVLSGGAVRHPRAEAEVMRGLALAQGLAPECLILESAARNTLENARHCRAIVRARNWRRVVVVTDSHHLPRALYAFRRLGVAAEGAAPASRASGRWLLACAREAVAFLLYVPRVERARRALWD